MTDTKPIVCPYCGGSGWLQAADVYRPVGHAAQVDWELAMVIPCTKCQKANRG